MSLKFWSLRTLQPWVWHFFNPSSGSSWRLWETANFRYEAGIITAKSNDVPPASRLVLSAGRKAARDKLALSAVHTALRPIAAASHQAWRNKESASTIADRENIYFSNPEGKTFAQVDVYSSRRGRCITPLSNLWERGAGLIISLCNEFLSSSPL